MITRPELFELPGNKISNDDFKAIAPGILRWFQKTEFIKLVNDSNTTFPNRIDFEYNRKLWRNI